MTGSKNDRPRREHTLIGPDAANPLGFLAVLGTLWAIEQVWPDHGAAVHWTAYANSHRAVLSWVGKPHAQADIIAALDQALVKKFEQHPISAVLRKNKSPTTNRFLQTAKANDSATRRNLNWLSALSSDFTDEKATSKLQTTRRDYFAGNVKSVIERCTNEHLRRCLFMAWDYADALDNQSLHLDPGEDRRHAYQWHQPSGDPDRKKRGGMIGANRLAIEAMPLFQCFGRKGRTAKEDQLSTVGFSGFRANNTRMTWPVWSSPLNIRTIASLLSLVELQKAKPNLIQLRQRGVSDLYRSRRILVGKTPNFTPAHVL